MSENAPQVKISVLLADDHPALRVGLRVLLEQGQVAVVGEVGDGRQALARIVALRPDVAVLDCQLPEMAGTEVALEVQRLGLPTRILALSAHSDEKYVRGMIAAGAVGYVLKEEAPEVIVAAVQAAATGQLWFGPDGGWRPNARVNVRLCCGPFRRKYDFSFTTGAGPSPDVTLPPGPGPRPTATQTSVNVGDG